MGGGSSETEVQEQPGSLSEMGISYEIADPEAPGGSRPVRLAMPQQRALKVLTAGSLRQAVAEGRTCGNCRFFDKREAGQLAVNRMFRELWNDAAWNEQWHDPNDFGFCAGALKRTAVEGRAQGCEDWQPAGAIGMFRGGSSR